MNKLSIENPEQLIYKNEILQLTVLGGIKLEGLDRMRITLKVQLQESSRPPVRHNLDLYNDTQLEKFIRKCAERLEIGTSIIAASLSELTEELEKYRLQEIKSKTEDLKPKIKQLTKNEIEEATNFLLNPNLLENTDQLIEQSGIIGENINRRIMYLIFTVRKQQNPLHVISLGASGSGKTHLQSNIAKLIPEEDVVKITTLTENALYYFGRYGVCYKVIIIEDMDGVETALYPIRELKSNHKIVKLVPLKTGNSEEPKTKMIIVEGPVCVAGCTTKEQIYEDNANRSFLLYLDESKEQDERIMEYQRQLSAGKIDVHKQREIQKFLQNVQRVLKPIRIINPFAEALVLPKSVFKPRRTNNHYLQFIEAVTYYYQYQREKKYDNETGEEYIEVAIEDIEIANQLLKETLLRKSDELGGATRNYLENLKAYLKTKNLPDGKAGKKDFTGLEIRTQLRIKESTLRNYNKQLQLLGYIKRNTNKKTRSYTFELVISKDYETLQKDIQTALGKALQKITKK